MRTPIQLLFLAGLCVCPAAQGADWPQWRGPNRDEVSLETGLLTVWPSGGPRLVLTLEKAGVGYSAPAIVGDRLFALGGGGDAEYVYAVDLASGRPLWSCKIGPLFHNGWGDGPRGTPTVAGDHVYALGAQGILVCVDAATGKRSWEVDLVKDLGGQLMSGWGYAESPLVDGDHVVCSPGGSKGTLAALDQRTGKVVWRSKDLTHRAAYSSIIAAEVGGLRQYIQMTDQGVVGVAAKDGRLLWHRPNAGNGTAVIPTPIFHDNHVFVTSGYGAGCALIRLTPAGNGTQAETVYTNHHMANQHGGVVRVGDHVYGYSDGPGWTCLEFKTGKVLWSERNKLGKGCLTCADGRLYCYAESDATVALVEASPTGWKETGRFQIPRQTKLNRGSGQIWVHPVIANGRLYLRDQDLIFGFDLRPVAADPKSPITAQVLDLPDPPAAGSMSGMPFPGLPRDKDWISLGMIVAFGISLAAILIAVALRVFRRKAV
jgi:outer membrane protein assembly factor BamB